MNKSLFVTVAGLFLVACGAQGSADKVATTAAVSSSVSSVIAAQASSASARSASQSRATLSSYRDGVLGSGQPALLFFSRADDVFSAQTLERLRLLYDAHAQRVSVYKVDFASATDLQRRYLVVAEDTVVLVDGAGGRLMSILHPSQEELQMMLRRAVR